MVVDLNIKSNPIEDKYVTSQKIEVTSLDGATFMIPEDQLQTDSKEGSWGHRRKRKEQEKKQKRTKTMILHLIKEENHGNLIFVSMISAIFWNIKGSQYQKSFAKIKKIDYHL